MNIIIAKNKANGKTLPFGTHGDAVQVEYGNATVTLSQALASIEGSIVYIEDAISSDPDDVDVSSTMIPTGAAVYKFFYDKKSTPIVNNGSTTSYNIQPYTYYKFINPIHSTFKLNCVTEYVSSKVNEFTFEFKTVNDSNASPQLVINHTPSIKWINGNAPTLNINKTYIVSIFNGYGIWVELDN